MFQSFAHEVLHTLAYSDFFSYPLQRDEILSNMGVACSDIHRLDAELLRLTQEGQITQYKGYYSIAEQPEALIEKRIEDEKRAKDLIEKAKRFATRMTYIPFVRGILLTGSLSKNVADVSDDIDYLIIVPKAKVWFVRTEFTLIKKILLLNNNDPFCVNYILAEDGLEISEKSRYTAYETATVKCLWNAHSLEMFQKSNAWIYNFLPNWQYPQIEKNSPQAPIIRTMLEWLCFPAFIPGFNAFLKNIWKRIWLWRHPELNEAQRNKLFSTTDTASSRWNIDYAKLIQEHIDNRLRSRVRNLAG